MSPPQLPPADADADAAALRRALALVESVAQLLDLPDGAALAAADFLLRAHAARAPDAPPLRQLAAASVFLACKTEECPRRTADLLHACARASAPRQHADPSPLPACFAVAAADDTSAPAAALAGDAYYAAKAELIAAEASLLRSIRYEVGAADAAPHKLLYNLAAQCGAPAGLVRAAAGALRDGCARSRVALRHAPEALAAGALRVAAALLGAPPTPPRGAATDALLGPGGDAAADAAAAELLAAVAGEARLRLAEQARAAAAAEAAARDGSVADAEP